MYAKKLAQQYNRKNQTYHSSGQKSNIVNSLIINSLSSPTQNLNDLMCDFWTENKERYRIKTHTQTCLTSFAHIFHSELFFSRHNNMYYLHSEDKQTRLPQYYSFLTGRSP
jgi:hypothetical protein